MSKESNFIVVNQMIKETSLEVKNSIQTFQYLRTAENRENISVKISLNQPKINLINQNNKQNTEIHELELQYTLYGLIKQEVIFVVEIIHSSIIKAENVSDKQKEKFYKQEYPFIIVPYIYCNAIQLLQEAGFTGLIIPPIEFADSKSVTILGHYVKDVSFQLNCLPEVFINIKNDEKELQDINIDFNVSSKQNFLQDKEFKDSNVVEIELRNTILVKKQGDTICTSEVIYAVVIKLNKELPQEIKTGILTVECPRLYFPFLIAVANKSFMDAGLGKINIPPIDFIKLLSNSMKTTKAEDTVTNV